MKNNCYDIEGVYFSLDKARKGHFNRFDLKMYMIDNGVRLGTIHESEIDLLMNFFDRSNNGQIKFNDFVDEFC